MLDDLFEFLQGAVTPYHAAAIAAAWLDAAGYTRLEEADYWNLEAGKGYYITRNGSSVIAWRVPEHAIGGWRIAASHSDSPCWKIKNESYIDLWGINKKDEDYIDHCRKDKRKIFKRCDRGIFKKTE